MKTKLSIITIGISILVISILSACAGEKAAPTPSPSPSQTASITPSPTPSPTPTITPTPSPIPTAFGGGGKPHIALIGHENKDDTHLLNLYVGYLGLQPDQIFFTKKVEIAELEGYSCPFLPISWSPDGTYLAYPGMNEGHLAIYLMDRISSVSELLVEFPEYDSIYAAGEFSWSPNGKLLAFISAYEQKERLYILDIDKKVLKRTDEARVYPRGWSKDGIVFYYMSGNGKQYNTMTDEISISRGKFVNVLPPSREEGAKVSSWSDTYSGGFFAPAAFQNYSDNSKSFVIIPDNDPSMIWEAVRFENMDDFHFQEFSLLPSPDGKNALLNAYGYDDIHNNQGYFSNTFLLSEAPYIKQDTKINQMYGIEWAPDSQSYLAFKDQWYQHQIEKQLHIIDANTQDILQTYSFESYTFPKDFVPCASLIQGNGLGSMDIYWPEEGL